MFRKLLLKTNITIVVLTIVICICLPWVIWVAFLYLGLFAFVLFGIPFVTVAVWLLVKSIKGLLNYRKARPVLKIAVIITPIIALIAGPITYFLTNSSKSLFAWFFGGTIATEIFLGLLLNHPKSINATGDNGLVYPSEKTDSKTYKTEFPTNP